MDKNLTKPKVTVLMPVYNGEKTVEKAIRSVLSQSFKDFEFLIVDDGSKDKTAKIISEYAELDKRIIYLKNESNLGIQKGLNRGLRHATGDFIARIDDDDEWSGDDKLEKQIQFLENNKDCVLVGTGAIVQDVLEKELFRFLNPTENHEIKRILLSKNSFLHPSVVFRKGAALSLGGYNENEETRHIEDHDLWLRMGIKGKLANLPIYGLKRTLSKNQISAMNNIEQLKKNVYLTKKYKEKYPNYIISLLRSYIRLIIFGYLKLNFSRKITAYFKKYK